MNPRHDTCSLSFRSPGSAASAGSESRRDLLDRAPHYGRSLPLSPSRRLVCDLLHYSRKVPSHAIARDCRFPRLNLLRKQTRPGQKIGWAALFVRAFGLLSSRRPELRQCVMTWPWAHIYEHPDSICRMTVSRRHDGEDRVFFASIERPDRMSLTQLQAEINQRKHDPIENVVKFRQQIVFSKLPTPIRRLVWWGTLNLSGWTRASRFGTFSVTSVAAAGAMSLHPPSTGNTTLTYGPIDSDGKARVTLVYDHRLLDGITVANCLRDLEDIMNGEVAEELSLLRADENIGERLRIPR